jgi:hypothetical protein
MCRMHFRGIYEVHFYLIWNQLHMATSSFSHYLLTRTIVEKLSGIMALRVKCLGINSTQYCQKHLTASCGNLLFCFLNSSKLCRFYNLFPLILSVCLYSKHHKPANNFCYVFLPSKLFNFSAFVACSILSCFYFVYFLRTTYNHHRHYRKHIYCENVWVSILKEQVNQIGNNKNNTKMKCVSCASSWSSSIRVIVITCCITTASCRYYYMFNIILLKEFILLHLLKAFLNEESTEIDYLVLCCLTWNKKPLIQDAIIILSISIHIFIHSWTHLSINININSLRSVLIQNLLWIASFDFKDLVVVTLF